MYNAFLQIAWACWMLRDQCNLPVFGEAENLLSINYIRLMINWNCIKTASIRQHKKVLSLCLTMNLRCRNLEIDTSTVSQVVEPWIGSWDRVGFCWTWILWGPWQTCQSPMARYRQLNLWFFWGLCPEQWAVSEGCKEVCILAIFAMMAAYKPWSCAELIHC